ncbi:MAG TPA: M23 family metallopeptidase [Acidimicrobiales bacterium]|nr:M23 family metallopeptidase [Acidimicrobiales bacterium]
MPWRRPERGAAAVLALAALVAGCGGATEQGTVLTRSPAPAVAAVDAPPATVTPSTTTPSTAPPTTTPPPSTAPVAPVTPPPPTALAPTTTAVPASPPPPAPARTVYDQAWTPFATVGGVVLRHPSHRVERVAFHESNHDGARQLEPLSTAAAPVTLESRHRGTGARTAVDVVSDPDAAIRAPVTGRVLRAGTYVLYCDNADDYAVIEPDERPGWEVKLLHIAGVLVRAGDRVVAGETVVAGGPTQLPFESQVDEITVAPAWPHVHIEVVDPSIPDRPSGGSC